MKPTVAVDVDEVLGAFVEAIARYHNEKHGTKLTLEDFHSYEFHHVWGGTIEETTSKVEDFFTTHHFERLEPIAEAAAALRALAPFFRFVVVTSRQHIIADQTRAWLSRHFPGIFDEILFGNAYGRDGVKRSKADLCRSANAIALIDDNEKYVFEVATAVPPAVGSPSQPGAVILFGEYAWHRSYSRAGASSFAASAADGSASGSGSGSGSASRPAAAMAMPRNVVRAVNWRHVQAILMRMRPAPSPAPLHPPQYPLGSSGAGSDLHARGRGPRHGLRRGGGGMGGGMGVSGRDGRADLAAAAAGAGAGSSADAAAPAFAPLRIRDAITIGPGAPGSAAATARSSSGGGATEGDDGAGAASGRRGGGSGAGGPRSGRGAPGAGYGHAHGSSGAGSAGLGAGAAGSSSHGHGHGYSGSSVFGGSTFSDSASAAGASVSLSDQITTSMSASGASGGSGGSGSGSGGSGGTGGSTGSTSADTAGYLDFIRRSLEVQDVLPVTGTGDDIRLVGLVCDMVCRVGDAVITGMRTGVDTAPPGRPRLPRLTITLQRTPAFLQKRFRPRLADGGATSAGVVAAEVHAAASAGGAPAPAAEVDGTGEADAVAEGADEDASSAGFDAEEDGVADIDIGDDDEGVDASDIDAATRAAAEISLQAAGGATPHTLSEAREALVHSLRLTD